MKRKTTVQPSFASLTESELEQLACDLQRETYPNVLARVRKPRSEGGLGLNLKSKTPLEHLAKKKNALDLLNGILISRGQTKLTLAEYQSMTSGTLTAFTALPAPTALTAGPSALHTPAPSQSTDTAASTTARITAIHDAILTATHIRVTEGDNSPHELLSLQRLADFPARVEIRHHREQLNREKFAHKLDMDHFRKHIATERLKHSQKSLELRHAITHARLQSQSHSPLDPDPYPFDPIQPSSSNQWWGQYEDHPQSVSSHNPTDSAEPNLNRWGEGAPEPTSTPAIRVDPIAQPSANSIPFIPDHGRGSERVSAQANISSEVFHPSPTSTSRAADAEIDAAPADQKTPNETAQENPSASSVTSVPSSVPRSGKSFISSGLRPLCNSSSAHAFPSSPALRDDTNPTLATPADHSIVGDDVRSPSPTQNSFPSQHSELSTQDLNPLSSLPFPLPFPSRLPAAVLANNLLYQQKIEAGEIIPISIPGELARVDYSNPADSDYFSTREKSGTARFVPDPNAATRHWLPPLRSFGPSARTQTSEADHQNLDSASHEIS